MDVMFIARNNKDYIIPWFIVSQYRSTEKGKVSENIIFQI